MADQSISRKYGGSVPDHLNVDEYPLPSDDFHQLEMAVVASYDGQKGGTQDPFEVGKERRYEFGISMEDLRDLAARLPADYSSSLIWFRTQGIAGRHLQIVAEYMRSTDPAKREEMRRFIAEEELHESSSTLRDPGA